ncbi:hypothetical protein CEXT_681361 [Caerostris extrusa]|uniref:Uncharacterized protein n=1 Tax=Caerostris extrusa TaxID=172846 RepID=A0AAV4RD90_CAEEX|nr:hypothetical protein CEXT_681361 [Caerostris extrusa]
MGQENRVDEPVVDKLGPIQAERHEAPDKEYAFQQPVKGNQGQNEVGEELDEREGGEDHPVGQPASVVFLVSRFDGQDGGIGWIGEANSVADDLSTVSNDDHGGHDETGCEDDLPSLDAGEILHFFQHFIQFVVFLQLLVQLQKHFINGKHLDGRFACDLTEN